MHLNETVWLGAQKKKLLGRGSITSPTPVKQKPLQLPHHNSSLHLFLPPSILPQSKSFLPAGFLNAIALGMARSTQNTFVIFSVLLTLFDAKSSFLKEQGTKPQEYVCFFSRQEDTRCGLVLLFLASGLKTTRKSEQITHML